MTGKKPYQNSLRCIWVIIFLAGCGGGPGIVQTGTPQQEVRSATPSQTAATPTPMATNSLQINGKYMANGHSLYIECLGSGTPTIVLETGEGGTLDEMLGFQKRLAEQTTTCAYDRANIGKSDSAPKPRTARDMVDDLHTLLASAGVPGPYILVGQSAGGLLVQLYARTYPEEVSGVVAMNPVPPAHPWLDQVKTIFTASEYGDEEGYYKGQNDESIDYLTSSQQLADSAKPPDIPFEMLLSTIAQCDRPDDVCGKSYSTYEQIEQEVAAGWEKGSFSEMKAGHAIIKDDLNAVVDVITYVLNHSTAAPQR